ncbi:helix-turn-helix domain-containing protein [Nonomuraea fastidiosa]|uniref:helix-turn-helix domain-containing protein n=1 Tax=Nonomuraea fastidiosa TaxID=46173 RepID=UPI00366D574A
MTQTRGLPAMRSHKRARFEEFHALYQQGMDPYQIADRLHVSDRTIWRYLRDLEGRPRRKDRYPRLKPRIMRHLMCYPQSWFTCVELVRVLNLDYYERGDGSSLKPTLRRMEKEGLIVSEKRPYNSRGYHVTRLVTWYRLAPGRQP